jgi:copper chaperone CopZ
LKKALKRNNMIKSVQTSTRTGWFIVNEDIEVKFIEGDKITADVNYDTEKYTEDKIKEIISELVEEIIEYCLKKEQDVHDQNNETK